MLSSNQHTLAHREARLYEGPGSFSRPSVVVFSFLLLLLLLFLFFFFSFPFFFPWQLLVQVPCLEHCSRRQAMLTQAGSQLCPACTEWQGSRLRVQSERLQKAWRREHTRFKHDYNDRLYNGLVLLLLVDILVFRFVIKFSILETLGWLVFVFLQVCSGPQNESACFLGVSWVPSNCKQLQCNMQPCLGISLHVAFTLMNPAAAAAASEDEACPLRT